MTILFLMVRPGKWGSFVAYMSAKTVSEPPDKNGNFSDLNVSHIKQNYPMSAKYKRHHVNIFICIEMSRH